MGINTTRIPFGQLYVTDHALQRFAQHYHRYHREWPSDGVLPLLRRLWARAEPRPIPPDIRAELYTRHGKHVEWWVTPEPDKWRFVLEFGTNRVVTIYPR